MPLMHYWPKHGSSFFALLLMSLGNGKWDPLQFLKFYDIENSVRYEDFGFPTVLASTTAVLQNVIESLPASSCIWSISNTKTVMRILSNALRRFQKTKNYYILTTGYCDFSGTVVAQCRMELQHVHLLQVHDANAFQKWNIQYGYFQWHQSGFKSPPNVIIEEWGIEILRVPPALLVQVGGARACTSKLMCLVHLQYKD